MNKPITPQEVAAVKAASFPPAVFECFNKRIAEAWDGTRSVVFQRQVGLDIADAAQVDTRTVDEKHWLDVEDAYRAAGWKVTYDKPDYNEQGGEARFVFERARVA